MAEKEKKPSLKDSPELDHNEKLKILDEFRDKSQGLLKLLKKMEATEKTLRAKGISQKEQLLLTESQYEDTLNLIQSARILRDDIDDQTDDAVNEEMESLIDQGFAPTSIKWIAENRSSVITLKKERRKAVRLVRKFEDQKDAYHNRTNNLKLLMRGTFQGGG